MLLHEVRQHAIDADQRQRQRGCGKDRRQHDQVAPRRERTGNEILDRRHARERETRIELAHRLPQRRREGGRPVGADQDEPAALASVQRPVHGALIRRIDAQVLHRTDDADDGRPRTRIAAAAVKAAPEHTFAGKEAGSPRTIHDDDIGSVLVEVRRLERSSFQQPETDRLEKLRRDADPRARGRTLTRRRWLILESDIVFLVDLVGRPAIRKGHGLGAGDGA